MRFLAFVLMLSLYSCQGSPEPDSVMAKESAYFTAIKKNDVNLSTPKKGEWLYEHKEVAQTFENYTSQHPATLSDTQFVIYLEPIGGFTSQQQTALELTRQYLGIFFQTKTVLLPPAADNLIPANAKRLRDGNNLQLLAPYILDSVLVGKVPKDAIAYMAFTAKDLYPQKDWNYVFGLASYSKRVGVSSIYRLQNKQLDSSNFVLFLQRLINVASHEIGHMFSISHCTFAKCVMNGSNSLAESDLSPNRLCSECSKKLYWNTRFDNSKRLAELTNFFAANRLTKDYKLLGADLETLNTED